MSIRRRGYLFACCLIISLAHADSINQTTNGWCNPAVNQTDGNVEIHCHGVSPKIVKRLEELLDKNEQDLIKAKKDVDHWLTKYNELTTQLAKRPATDEFAAKAKALLDNGELEAAELLLKKSLEHRLARRKQLAQEQALLNQAIARDAYDLGSIKELQLAYQEARTYYEQAAFITPNNTTYLNQAGLINAKLAAFKKAIGYYEQALASDLNTYGADHPQVAIYRNNLGMAWNSLGKYEKAIGYYEQALVTFEHTLGTEHPSTKTVRNNLSLVKETMKSE